MKNYNALQRACCAPVGRVPLERWASTGQVAFFTPSAWRGRSGAACGLAVRLLSGRSPLVDGSRLAGFPSQLDGPQCPPARSKGPAPGGMCVRRPTGRRRRFLATGGWVVATPLG